MKYVHVQYCTHYHKTNISNIIRQNFNFVLKYIYFFFDKSFSHDLHVCEFYYHLFWLHHNPLFTGYLYKGTPGNCADPDQMGHNEVSDQGLHCYLRNFYLLNNDGHDQGTSLLKEQYSCSYDFTARLNKDLLGNTVKAQNTSVYFFTFPWTRLAYVTDGR